MEHNQKVIGIIGCGGALGSFATKILTQKYMVLGGQRSEPTALMSLNHFKWLALDLYDEASLKAFCSKCDVVLNCAGPSYRILDHIFKVANAMHIPYVDVSGTALFAKDYSKEALENMVVLAAGYIPGLSGLVPLYIADKEFDDVTMITGYQGGRQQCTECSFMDILSSAMDGDDISDAYYKDGQVLYETLAENEKVYIPGFREPVYLKSVMSKETLKVAEILNALEVHWYNVVPDERVMEIMKESYGMALIKHDVNALKEIACKAAHTIQIANMDDELWNMLIVEIEGHKDGKFKRIRMNLEIKDGYHVCGAIAALIVESIVEDKPKQGMYWAFQQLEAKHAIEFLQEENAIMNMTIIEADVPLQSTSSDDMEFDEL